MNSSYLPRLVFLCFASFFVVYTGAALAAAAIAPRAARLAEGMRARAAARLLLALRLAPVYLAVGAVAGLCVPSYLWLEPAAAEERLGIACIATAVLGAALCAIGIARGCRAIAAARRFSRRAGVAGSPELVSQALTRTVVVDEATPLLVLCGVLRPRI